LDNPAKPPLHFIYFDSTYLTYKIEYITYALRSLRIGFKRFWL